MLDAGFSDRIRQRLEEKARNEAAQADTAPDAAAVLESSLVEVRRKLAQVEENMALAGPGQFAAVARVFDRLQQQEKTIDEQLRVARQQGPARNTSATDVDAALAVLDRLAPLADELDNLAAVGALFARLYLRFAAANWGKRSVNRVSGGVVTFGATPPPVTPYDGPTGRRALSARPENSPVSGDNGGLPTRRMEVGRHAKLLD